MNEKNEQKLLSKSLFGDSENVTESVGVRLLGVGSQLYSILTGRRRRNSRIYVEQEEEAAQTSPKEKGLEIRRQSKSSSFRGSFTGSIIRSSSVDRMNSRDLLLIDNASILDSSISGTKRRDNVYARNIPFDSIVGIKLCIDKGKALPVSSTITRVTVSVASPDGTPLEGTFSKVFSDPTSHHQFPSFQWSTMLDMSKVKTDMTIVFRVDTIDRVSLQPRLIGFSALKLFSDVKGRQVMKENSKANLFLNSGIYMLPIYYGLLAPSITVTEDAFDLLPKVPDSFLKVRLFDPTLQEDLNNEDYTNLHRSDSNQPVDSSGSPVRISADSAHDDNFVSIVTALVTSPSFLSHDIKDVPEKSIQSIFYGLPLKPTERSIVVDRFSHWGRARYSSLEIWNFDDMRNKNTGLLDLKYSLSYNDRSGAAIALDMLYNMPLRKNIMRSTAASSTVKAIRSGLARGWDTRVNCYKTAFRYLQGEEDMPDSNNEQGLKSSFDFTEHGQWIVDDASMELDVNSYEAYPMYKDDFSSTASLKLTSNSCLLVIVTAVDVLTTKTSVIGAESAFNSTQLKYSMRIKETDHNSSSVFSPRISERSSSFKSMEEKKEKLKGLIGIHIGHQEPESTWWGLLPLMLKSPFVSPTEDDAVDTVDAVSLSKFGERNKSAAPIDSYCPATESSEGFPLKKNHSGALISREKEINSIYFANIGTHQVPLFQGMPPEDLISSAKPMKWLIEMLKDQRYVDGNFIEPRFSFFYPVRRLFGSQSKEMKRLKKKRKKYNFRCSLGSSAIVRLGDYRHKELINNKIEQLDNLNCVMNDETLFRILRATAVRYAQSGEQKEIGGTTTEMSETSTIALPSGRTAEGCVDHRGMFIVDNNLLAKQMNQFKYKPYNKLPVARTIKSAIPQNIDAEMLVREMNQKFCQAISE